MQPNLTQEAKVLQGSHVSSCQRQIYGPSMRLGTPVAVAETQALALAIQASRRSGRQAPGVRCACAPILRCACKCVACNAHGRPSNYVYASGGPLFSGIVKGPYPRPSKCGLGCLAALGPLSNPCILNQNSNRALTLLAERLTQDKLCQQDIPPHLQILAVIAT